MAVCLTILEMWLRATRKVLTVSGNAVDLSVTEAGTVLHRGKAGSLLDVLEQMAQRHERDFPTPVPLGTGLEVREVIRINEQLRKGGMFQMAYREGEFLVVDGDGVVQGQGSTLRDAFLECEQSLAPIPVH